MKLESHFSSFLEKTVNLNKSRFEVAELGIRTMKSFLSNNDTFGDLYIDAIPQGSFRQETIIKPVSSEHGFDVDLLFDMEVVEGWEPKDYLEKLIAEYKATDRYKDLVDTRGKERCVTIDYESDFHIDIVPSIKINDSCYIMNKATNQFEATDGDGYAEWFTRQNDITGKKHLTKVVRLMKYIRDSQKKFEIKSILLTTLIGNEVYASDSQGNYHTDVATSFVTLINRLDAVLQSNATMPTVRNPALPTEDFNRKWSQEKYTKFRNEIHTIAVLANDAYQEPNENESLKKWQKIFGNSFVTPVTVVNNGDEDITVTREEADEIALGDYSHRELPPWPKNIQGTVEIKRCDVRSSRLNMSMGSNAYPITDGHNLNYIAETTGISGPYEVWWQVVNTGSHAVSIGTESLRGKIETPKDPSRPLQQKEFSSYTGKHWIQCFIVKAGYLVAESDPFFVNIVNKKRSKFKFRK